MSLFQKMYESSIGKIKVPADLMPPTKYLITGGKLPSEHQAKLARVLDVVVGDEAALRIKKGIMTEKDLVYQDLWYNVKTEHGDVMLIDNTEIDHVVERMP